MYQKYLGLFCILTGFFTSTAVCQVVFPASLQKHRDELSPVAREYLAALDRPAKADKGEVQTESSAVAQLDSTVTSNMLDVGGGNIILLPSVREDYIYPTANLVYIATSEYIGGAWHLQQRIRNTYDDLGRLLVSFAETYNPEFELWENDSRFRVFPYGDSFTLMDSLLVEGWSTELNGWVRLLTVKNTFNAEGQLTESLSRLVLNDIPVIFKDLYYYNIDGRNELIETFLVLDGLEIPAGRQEFEYDLGLVTTSTSSVYDEFGTAVPTERTEYTYIFNFWVPKTVRTLVWQEESESWQETSLTETSYDTYLRVDSIEYIVFPTDPEALTERELVTYGYRTDHLVAYMIEHSYDMVSEEYVRETITQHYYSDIISSLHPDPKFQALQFGPNPTHGVIYMVLEQEASIEVLNISGQLIRRIHGSQGSNTVDLSALPAGVYPLRVHTDGITHVGRVVKL